MVGLSRGLDDFRGAVAADWANSARLEVLQRASAATPCCPAPVAGNTHAQSVCLGHDNCESLIQPGASSA